MTRIGAGVILYYKDDKGVYHILVGHESRYVQDGISDMKLRNPETGTLFDAQSFSEYQNVQTNSLTDAMAIFDWRARSLSEIAHQHIRYDKPKYFSDSAMYRTHYRICSNKNVGICKGRREYYDSTLYSTALRELTEEAGIRLKKQNVTGMYVYNQYDIHHTIYMIELTDQQREEAQIKINVRNADYYGELFQLHFLPLVGTYKKDLNTLTKSAVYDFLCLMKKRSEKP